jgi:eukaryotic-like serine/threonine-protein kinase
VKLEPGTNLGPYRIVGEAGRGGMASVYKAHQAALARYVAIKVLPDFFATEPGFLERFQQEAVAVAQLRHPNILAIFDYGETDGVTYIVTEFVDGGTLADQMGKPLPVEYAVEILNPIAGALDYAHRRGVLHRDVKPSNVLLQHDGTPVLSDFGLAKMMMSANKRITQSGMIVGTPEYMSPEQCAGEDLTPATDQYSLAVIAYEALTGRVPFTAATPVAVLMAQMQNALPPPRTINPELSDGVAAVLLKGLAKEPGDRYKTCHQLVRALAAADQSAGGVEVAEPVAPQAPAPPPLTPPPAAAPTPPPQAAPIPPPTPPPQAQPYYTPAPQPPPYYTPPAQPAPYQPQYYQQPQPYYRQPAPAGPTGTPTWLIVSVAASLAAALIMALIGVLGIAGSPNDPSTQTAGAWWALISLGFAVLSMMTLVGVVRRKAWGLVMSWITAVLLCLTCVGLVFGIPIMVFAARTRF